MANETPKPLLAVQIEKLSGHAQNILAVADRIHALADRVIGPRGPVTAVPLPSASAVHALAQMDEAGARINRARDALVEAVQRLEAAVKPAGAKTPDRGHRPNYVRNPDHSRDPPTDEEAERMRGRSGAKILRKARQGKL